MDDPTTPEAEVRPKARGSQVPTAVPADDALPGVQLPIGVLDLPGEPGAGPLARIRLALPELSAALQACGEFVLAHAWEARGLSIYEVATRSGVSTHAVHRLSRRIGYGGYREFSQALVLELGRIVGAAYAVPVPLAQVLAEGIDNTRGTAGAAAALVSQVLALEQTALQDTRRSLDPDSVARAVQALVRARHVLFVTVGAGQGVCQLAAYRFKVLGQRATCAVDLATVIPEIHLLESGDVVVGVSYHGSSRAVADGLAYARERELTTISITATTGSRVAVTLIRGREKLTVDVASEEAPS